MMSYDAAENCFNGFVENTTDKTLQKVRVEVHLSNGIELGPTTPADLGPGVRREVKLRATDKDFDAWTAHPEVGGSGEGGSESGSEGGGEESGMSLSLNETYDRVRGGARLVLSYDAAENCFNGFVENTADTTLQQVRVEVHLSNGVELGPTTPADLGPGARREVKLCATGKDFDAWTAHPEVGGSGEGGSESGSEGGGEHSGSGEGGSEGGGEHSGSGSVERGEESGARGGERNESEHGG